MTNQDRASLPEFPGDLNDRLGRAFAELGMIRLHVSADDSAALSKARGAIYDAISVLAAPPQSPGGGAEAKPICYPDADLSSGLSYDGMLVCGSHDAIKRVRDWLHSTTDVVPCLRNELMNAREQIAVLRAPTIKESLTASPGGGAAEACRALVEYDTKTDRDGNGIEQVYEKAVALARDALANAAAPTAPREHAASAVLRAIERALQDHTAAEVLDENSPLRGAIREMVAQSPASGEAPQEVPAVAVQAEPMFWVRLLRDGLYEGPVHHNSVGGKMLRDEKPGEWHPLYLAAHPEPAAPIEAVQDVSDAQIAEVAFSFPVRAGTQRKDAIAFARAILALRRPAHPVGAVEPFGYWHQGATEEESDFFKHSDSGNVACESCIKLYDHAAPVRAVEQPALAVWFGSMPESNGKKNWTVMLHRKGGDIWEDGLTIGRSEYQDRERYEADRLRYLLGEIAERPDILKYDPELGAPKAEPAVLTQGKGEAAWQPIETAPKDGRIVMYWVASARFAEDEETGQQHEIDVSAVDFGCWMDGGEHGEGYHDPFGGIPGDQGGATHWMPLPAAPDAARLSPPAEGGES